MLFVCDEDEFALILLRLSLLRIQTLINIVKFVLSQRSKKNKFFLDLSNFDLFFLPKNEVRRNRYDFPCLDLLGLPCSFLSFKYENK